MLSRLELENYRGFQQYRLSGLARVNLLVGKNNCGKTSVLEAVQLLASQGDPRIFSKIAMQRGEMISVGDKLYPDVSHLFYDRTFNPNISFSIVSDGQLGSVRIRLANPSELDEEQQRLFDFDVPASYPNHRRASALRDILRAVFAIKVEGNSYLQSLPALPVSDEGALLFEQSRYARLGKWRREEISNVQFITSESLEPRLMTHMWDKVITEGREAEVIQAMKILEPELANIFFLSGDSAFRYGSRAGILVAFEDVRRRRVPLGSFGEGMRRLLALSLSLNRTQGGILLVDEIETGLHYSILGDMWLLVVNAAKQYGIQVFATTHSLDCIRGLAWLCEQHPGLAGDVSVQKIDRSLGEAVALDSNKIRIAVEQDLEVR